MSVRTESGDSGGLERLNVTVTDLVAAVEAAGAAICVTHTDGRILAWSAGAETMLGWAAADVLGLQAGDVTDWGVSQADAATILLATPELPWAARRMLATRDGELREVQLGVLPVGPAHDTVLAAATATTGEGRRRWFRALLGRSTDLAVITDAEVVIRYAGPSLQTMFGYTPDEVVGVSGWQFVHPDDEARTRSHWEQALAAPGPRPSIELRIRDKHGDWHWVEERVTNLLDDPDVAGIVVNLRDITDRHQAVDILAAREQFLSSILAAAQEGVWVVDADGRTLFANARMAEILGVSLEEVHTRSVWDFFEPASQQIVRAELERRRDGATGYYELPYLRRDGERRWMLISAAPLSDENGAHIGSVGMTVDITERKQIEQQLQRLALYDPLTGLPNRALLHDRLEQLLARHRRAGGHVGLLFCDIDRFKLVNDNRGHHAGDELLVQVAQRLAAAVRDIDTLARFGGDEFVVLCPDADTWTARRVAGQVAEAFTDPFDVAGQQVTVGVSVGVAATDDVPTDELLQAADRALYVAKTNGRGRVEVHDLAMRASTKGRLALVTDLRAAIAADSVGLHYQPIVHADGSIVGAEALLRWTHAEHGPVPPSTLVTLAEESGLIAALGAWSLRRACNDIATTPEASATGLRVAVNLSSVQLRDQDIVATVRSALAVSGLPAQRLILEVTETAVMNDIEQTTPILRQLKALGCQLALDDFGTGYSSLSYLRAFPIDTIKIDRSFVAGMPDSPDDHAIVASLVGLAASVGLTAVAEGVETSEQADALRRLGCTAMQGFLWSAAVPLAELAVLLRRGPFPPTPLRTGRARGARPVIRADQDDRKVRARILALHTGGASPTTIAAALNADGLRTPDGTRWHRNTVARVVADAGYPHRPRDSGS
jgi:diguanylate cyclase (GGDEF)-like protein/PAS domain S-box-containing protein